MFFIRSKFEYNKHNMLSSFAIGWHWNHSEIGCIEVVMYFYRSELGHFNCNSAFVNYDSVEMVEQKANGLLFWFSFVIYGFWRLSMCFIVDRIESSCISIAIRLHISVGVNTLCTCRHRLQLYYNSIIIFISDKQKPQKFRLNEYQEK